VALSAYIQIFHYIHNLLQAWGKFQLKRNISLDFMKNRPPDAFAPDWADLWFLYKIVREKKPRCILEFGSGCSTCVFAYALWQNHEESPEIEGHLYSVDADKHWTEVTAGTIPPHLRSYCDISYSPVLEIDYKGRPAFRHANIPEIVPDFLYVDGPRLKPPERFIVVDPLDLEDRFAAGFCLVIDGMTENMWFTKEHLKKQYRFKHRRIVRNSIFELID